MTPDEIKELKELIEFLKENDIGEFDLERGDLKVRIKFGHPSHGTPGSALDIARLGQLLSAGQHAPAAPSQGIHAVASASPGAATDVVADEEEKLHIVKSPIVGTFYESGSPGSPPFVRVGERVQPGKVLCIIESMKLMNEIEAETSGIIESKLVMNGQPVEYGEALFAVRAV